MPECCRAVAVVSHQEPGEEEVPVTVSFTVTLPSTVAATTPKLPGGAAAVPAAGREAGSTEATGTAGADADAGAGDDGAAGAADAAVTDAAANGGTSDGAAATANGAAGASAEADAGASAGGGAGAGDEAGVAAASSADAVDATPVVDVAADAAAGNEQAPAGDLADSAVHPEPEQ